MRPHLQLDPDVARIAALIGDPSRAAILLALSDGRALPAGELARHASISTQTASAHLDKLFRAHLLAVEIQGQSPRCYPLRHVNDTTMRLLLSRLGLNPERDVTLIQVGDSAPVVATSLIAGKTFDGGLLQPPYYNIAVESGMRVFANMEEMDIPFQQVGLNTTQRYIAKNPDMVRRVVKSIIDGMQLTRANPAVAKRAIARYMQIQEEQVLEESYEIKNQEF